MISVGHGDALIFGHGVVVAVAAAVGDGIVFAVDVVRCGACVSSRAGSERHGVLKRHRRPPSRATRR